VVAVCSDVGGWGEVVEPGWFGQVEGGQDVASAPAAAAAATSGVRNREIEDTSRASASRSTLSARPKLCTTFATGLPLTG